jgi:hypothetical protein
VRITPSSWGSQRTCQPHASVGDWTPRVRPLPSWPPRFRRGRPLNAGDYQPSRVAFDANSRVLPLTRRPHTRKPSCREARRARFAPFAGVSPKNATTTTVLAYRVSRPSHQYQRNLTRATGRLVTSPKKVMHVSFTWSSYVI